MIPATSLKPSNFFEIKQTPESREVAISYTIQGFGLQAVSKAWEDQIKPDLKGKDEFLNVTEVYDGRVKAITKVCDDRIRGLNKKLADRVDSISKRFILIAAYFEKHGHVRDIKDECDTLRREISADERDCDAIILLSEAGLKAIKDVWKVKKERLKQNPLELEAQDYQYDIFSETSKQVEAIRLRSRNVSADLYVMETENTPCKDPQARIEEIKFIDTYLSSTLSAIATVDTILACSDKKEEALPFFIFLMVYLYALGDLSKKELPWFLPHYLRQEIQHLRNENPSYDLSIQRLRQKKFFCDYKDFGSWKYAPKDNPTLEKLVKISDKILEDKEFISTFVDCWHAHVEFREMGRYEAYESYQALKTKRAEAEASLALSKSASVKDRDFLLESIPK